MRARDVGALIGLGLALAVAAWIATAMLVSAGWTLPPGSETPTRMQ